MKSYFIDRVGVLEKLEKTPQGGSKVSATLTKPGVMDYSTEVMRRQKNNKVPPSFLKPITRVYTPPEVLQAGLDTLKDAPVTREHPPKMVDPSTYKEVTRGTTNASSVQFDGTYVRADLAIQDAELLEDIEHNVRREVSLGYYSDYDYEPGVTPEGEAYDAVRRSIFYNHVAVVKAGRAGQSVCLALDSADINLGEETMTVKIKGVLVAAEGAQAAVDGLEGELAVKVSEIDALSKEVTELKTKLAKAESQETKDSWIAEKDAKDLAKKVREEKITKVKAAGIACDDSASEGFLDGALAAIKADPDGLKSLKTVETKEAPVVKDSKPVVSARQEMLARSRILPTING